MATADLDQILKIGARAMGVPLTDAQADKLITLVAELIEWNGRFNLTAITEPPEIVRKHLLDSLAIQPFLHGRRVADVGTGAGFPGLPLAVVNPDREFALIDSTGKKVKFVEHAAARLGLQNVTAVNARAEAWQSPKPFDTVVSRALGKARDFIRVAGHLAGHDGRLLAMKGRSPDAELESLPPGWKVLAVHHLEVPGLDAERCVVEFARAPRR